MCSLRLLGSEVVKVGNVLVAVTVLCRSELSELLRRGAPASKGEADLTGSTMAVEEFGEDRSHSISYKSHHRFKGEKKDECRTLKCQWAVRVIEGCCGQKKPCTIFMVSAYK